MSRQQIDRHRVSLGILAFAGVIAIGKSPRFGDAPGPARDASHDRCDRRLGCGG